MFTHGMSTVSLADDIGGKGTDGIYGEVVGRQGGETGHRSQKSLEDGGEGWGISRTVGSAGNHTWGFIWSPGVSARIFPRWPATPTSSLTSSIRLVITG